ncbi:MAG: amino acid permease [Desulfovibrionaceae bacterium]|nr:amino acid permease [Desulfovibrionaceae bacterium]
MSQSNIPNKEFSPLSIWAMSFGCCVGWGAFVLPGTTFLPIAGPVGSSLALIFGAIALLIIALNYHFMAQHSSSSGGAFTYVRSILGSDHGFLCGWFLWLVYAAIIWANASAFTILIRQFFGTFLQFGFHYNLAGYDIYLGEILFNIAIIIGFLSLCMYRNKFAIKLNTILAIILLLATSICFILINGNVSNFAQFDPPFVPDRNIFGQIINCMTLAPWAFVGFEAVSNVVPEMKTDRKYLFILMLASLMTAAIVYSLLIFVASTPMEGLADWKTYSEGVGPDVSSTKTQMVSMTVIKSVSHYLGPTGIKILALAVLAAVGTGVLGFSLALSRLTAAAADDGFLPAWFGVRNAENVPTNAFLFIIGSAILISFTGRTAIGWIVDLNNICATIVYAYVSIAAFLKAKEVDNLFYKIFGILGIILAFAFCLFNFTPSLWSITVLSTESYFIFATWGILGFAFFLYLFTKDHTEKFGKSTFVWSAIFFLVFGSSVMWMRQDVHNSMITTINKVTDFYDQQLKKYDPEHYLESSLNNLDKNSVLSTEIDSFSQEVIKHTIIQLFMISVCIAILFRIYSLMNLRRQKVELEKIKAEEVSRSKSTFLSNMSHDIRTPMNAIIGFTDLALTKTDLEVIYEYLNKIKLSSNHLLSLINDVLEMSRIESGRVELQESNVSIPEILHNLNAIIIGQIESKQQTLELNVINVRDENIKCDKLRLNQVLLNLLSNAIKYTQTGGKIEVTIKQINRKKDLATYEISVKDNGLGMSKEFAAKIFTAFERENTSTVNKIQGTGLGMAITKHLVDLMHGTINLTTEKGHGSEFLLSFTFPVADSGTDNYVSPQINGLHILVADDDYGSCDALTGMLKEMGARVEWTMSGKEAILRCQDAAKRHEAFDVCLIDWKMPDISGINVAQQITSSAADKKPAIILITAYDWLNVKEEAMQAGIKTFCNKPIFASELQESLLNALNLHHQSRQEDVSSAQARDFKGTRVLLVDDIDVNREIAQTMLEMNGFVVEEAENGQVALDKVAEAAPGYYDVILMDMQMPVMNGIDSTKAIRALADPKKASVPIIAMTANAFDEDKKTALDAGMNAHIAKPIDVATVLKTLAEII